MYGEGFYMIEQHWQVLRLGASVSSSWVALVGLYVSVLAGLLAAGGSAWVSGALVCDRRGSCSPCPASVLWFSWGSARGTSSNWSSRVAGSWANTASVPLGVVVASPSAPSLGLRVEGCTSE